MNRLNKFLVWLAVAIILIVTILNFIATADLKKRSTDSKDAIDLITKNIVDSDRNINNKINQLQNNIDAIPTNKGEDGTNGRDGKDGTNGKNGIDGENSKSTHTVEKNFETNKIIEQVAVNGKDGKDGRTQLTVCNRSKNRWEYTFTDDLNWRAMLWDGQVIKCTI